MSTFDPSLLPDPLLLRAMRRPPPSSPTDTAEWYTPMLLFGQLSLIPVIQPLGIVGRIPIIYPCTPIGWYLSANVATVMTLTLAYAPPPEELVLGQQLTIGDLQVSVSDTPVYNPLIFTANLPTLGDPGSLTPAARGVFEQTPSIAGWPTVLNRYSELQIEVTGNTAAEQTLLVLYMRKLKLR